MTSATHAVPDARLRDLETVRQLAHETPLVDVPGPGGTTLWLKLESAQPVHSFKLRGATYALAARLDELRGRGVVADSGGNHSQALAYAGARLGVPVTIVMASLVPEVKQRATAGFGAGDGSFVLDTSPRDFVAAKARARQLAGEQGRCYVSPYDDEHILRGAATVLPELLAQLRDRDAPRPHTVHAPIGGGGLIGGLADVTDELGHPFELHGHRIEPAGLPYAEGLAAPAIGECGQRRLRAGLVADVHVSTLADVGRAYHWWRHEVLPRLGVAASGQQRDDSDNPDDWPWRQVPEVSSMVAVAGAMRDLEHRGVLGGHHVVVITGGNTDPTKAAVALEAWRSSAAADKREGSW